MISNNLKIAVISQGYVGFPLAYEFGKKFDAIIVAVAHDTFKKIDYIKILKENNILYDIKGILKNKTNLRL